MTDFVFDASNLDANQAQKLVDDALDGADDGELFVERSASESLTFDDGRLKTANFDTSRGFGLRCVAGESSGFAQSTDLSPGALSRAVQAVSLAKQGFDGKLATSPLRTNRQLYNNIDPVSEPGFGVKVELLQEIDAYCRALDPEVVQVTASMSANRRAISILRAGGERYDDIRPLVRLNIMITAERNGRRENGFAGAGGRKSFDGYIDPDFWKPLAKEALRQAQVNLESVPAPAGQMDVVLGPGWPGVLLHEAMGHGLEGDFIRKGTSAFAGMLGERRLNSRLMGVKPTGNGRRESFAHSVMPRMTNTFMLGGDRDPGEMLAELKDGVYATNFGGGQVDITNGKFVFQCTEAYRVRNGKIEEPLKGVTLIGDGPTVLTQIRHVGNDMELDPGIGICGKAGQSVPVGVGQPSLYVENLTVGGSAV